ncbi:MAG TPA: hypothetical protein VFR19_20090 [Hyphomicrobiaceae bacterium]|jgi:hypothetical protein|nr:hypothetical protein [Hyphomicrobiaceae bacterium]
MKFSTLALLWILASLPAGAYATSAWAGSCSHCVFDDEPPVQPTPKRADLG